MNYFSIPGIKENNSIKLLFETVASVCLIDVDDIFKKSRKLNIVEARRLIAYVLFLRGFTNVEIAKILILDRTTIYHHIIASKNLMIYESFRTKFDYVDNSLKNIPILISKNHLYLRNKQ